MQDKIDNPSIFISVIIPSFNTESTIAKTIHSVQQQTYNGWEIIVVDDGSTDGTPSLLKYFSEQDSRIRIVTQSNQGVSEARNTGMKEAQYEWLLFLPASWLPLNDGLIRWQ